MGSGSKSKKGGIDMGNYTGSIKEQSAYVWCVHNGIYISPKAKSSTEWYISITSNGKTNVSPKAYEKVDIWKELYKFYVYYYNKYSGENIPIEEVKQVKKKAKPIEKQKENELF